MQGTVVCAVTDGVESEQALELAAELSERLGLRLVLVQAVDGFASGDAETVTSKANRGGAEQRLARLAEAYGVAARAERRVAVGEPAALVAQVAAEEAADVIVVGARARGWPRRLECRLAVELESETPVPVLIAPPGTRNPGGAATVANGGRR